MQKNLQFIVDFLIKSGRVPRLHGNGFIQLDIGPNARLHIWTDESADAQLVNTQIHDHRFSLHSTILLGKLRHTEYEVQKICRIDEPIPNRYSIDELYRIYTPKPRDREDTVLVPEQFGGSCLYQIREAQVIELTTGSSYTFRSHLLHDTVAFESPTATLMIKTKQEPATILVRVLCLANVEPDNDFNRYQFSTDVLWQIITSTIAAMSDDSIRLLLSYIRDSQ